MEGYKPQDFSFFHRSEKLVQQPVYRLEPSPEEGEDLGERGGAPLQVVLIFHCSEKS